MVEEKEIEEYRKEVASLLHQVYCYIEVRGDSNIFKYLLEEHDKNLQIQETSLRKVV
jgi:hypothetical protein